MGIGSSPSATAASCPRGLRVPRHWLPTTQVAPPWTEGPSGWHCPPTLLLAPPGPSAARGWYIPLFPWREEGPGSQGLGCKGGERKPFPPRRLLCARSVGRYCHCLHITEEETGAGLWPELCLQAHVLPRCSHVPTLLGLGDPQRGQIWPESQRAKPSPRVWLSMEAREGCWPGAGGLDHFQVTLSTSPPPPGQFPHLSIKGCWILAAKLGAAPPPPAQQSLRKLLSFFS